MKTVCGIRIFNPITIDSVRDTLSACFNQCHGPSAGLDGADSETLNIYCAEIVKKAFIDLGVDYDNPDKEGLIRVNNFLTEFALKFHDKEIIRQYHDEINELINKLS